MRKIVFPDQINDQAVSNIPNWRLEFWIYWSFQDCRPYSRPFSEEDKIFSSKQL